MIWFDDLKSLFRDLIWFEIIFKIRDLICDFEFFVAPKIKSYCIVIWTESDRPIFAETSFSCQTRQKLSDCLVLSQTCKFWDSILTKCLKKKEICVTESTIWWFWFDLILIWNHFPNGDLILILNHISTRDLILISNHFIFDFLIPCRHYNYIYIDIHIYTTYYIPLICM